MFIPSVTLPGFRSFRIAIVLLSIANLSLVPMASPKSAENVAERVAEPLRSVIGELRVSKTPVLLPTWLPPMGQYNYTSLYACGDGEGYGVSLDSIPCAIDRVPKFSLYGCKAVLRPYGRKVNLGGGRVGYLHHNLIDWADGKYCYGMKLSLYPGDEKKTVAALIRSAKSMVNIPVAEMYRAPRGDDRLAKACILEKQAPENRIYRERRQKKD